MSPASPVGRPWTADDRRLLAAHLAAGRPAVEAAAALGRSVSAVRIEARKSGGFRAVATAARAERRRVVVRAAAATGRLAAAARAAGVSYNTARAYLTAAGAGRPAPDYRAAGRDGVRVVAARTGLSPAALGHAREEADSLAAGWPAVAAGARRHLETFYAGGPATVKAHAARAGVTRAAVGPVVRRLVAAGHLVAVGAAAVPRSTGAVVYDLAPAVRKHRRWYLRLWERTD